MGILLSLTSGLHIFYNTSTTFIGFAYLIIFQEITLVCYIDDIIPRETEILGVADTKDAWVRHRDNKEKNNPPKFRELSDVFKESVTEACLNIPSKMKEGFLFLVLPTTLRKT